MCLQPHGHVLRSCYYCCCRAPTPLSLITCLFLLLREKQKSGKTPSTSVRAYAPVQYSTCSTTRQKSAICGTERFRSQLLSFSFFTSLFLLVLAFLHSKGVTGRFFVSPFFEKGEMGRKIHCVSVCLSGLLAVFTRVVKGGGLLR